MKKLIILSSIIAIFISSVALADNGVSTDKSTYYYDQDTEVLVTHPDNTYVFIYNYNDLTAPILGAFEANSPVSYSVQNELAPGNYAVVSTLEDNCRNPDTPYNECITSPSYIGSTQFSILSHNPCETVTIGSTTLGCSIDGLNSSVAEWFGVILIKYWPFTVGFIILMIVLGTGKRILRHFSD